MMREDNIKPVEIYIEYGAWNSNYFHSYEYKNLRNKNPKKSKSKYIHI